MPTTVEITQADDGSFTVGMVDQPSADVDSQQQVGSIADALKMAQHLLSSPPADTDQGDDQTGANGAQADPNAGAAGAQAQGDPNAPAGAAQPSATDMWNEVAAQGTPPH